MSRIIKYDIAISFAGEDRTLANFLATGLQSEYRVFYDDFERAALWGADLSIALPDRYADSRFCVILQSKEYLTKVWTTLERQALVLEFLRRRGRDYLLPIRVRGCTEPIPGLSELVGYLSIDSLSDWQSALDLLKQKLSM